MSEILIKNMKMPARCEDCPMGHELAVGTSVTGYGCLAMLRMGDARIRPISCGTRPDWCPLIEVPTPHGRLIDADAKVQTQLYDDEHEEWTDVEMTVEEDLGYCNNEVPTIIETEPKQKKYSTSEWCSECQRQKCLECCTAILKDGEVDEPTGFQRIQHIEDAPTIIPAEEGGT